MHPIHTCRLLLSAGGEKDGAYEDRCAGNGLRWRGERVVWWGVLRGFCCVVGETTGRRATSASHWTESFHLWAWRTNYPHPSQYVDFKLGIAFPLSKTFHHWIPELISRQRGIRDDPAPVAETHSSDWQLAVASQHDLKICMEN